MTTSASSTTTRLQVGLGLLGWLSMIGFDFFLHAGVLANVYEQESPFLLPLEQAFARIPLGYLAFLIYAGLLVWLTVRLDHSGWRAGGQFGLILGGVIWSAGMLGIYSIASAPIPLLTSWFVGQTIEMGIGGAVIGSGISGEPLKPALWIRVVGFVLLCLVLGIVLQNSL